jgi:hypothetical protein
LKELGTRIPTLKKAKASLEFFSDNPMSYAYSPFAPIVVVIEVKNEEAKESFRFVF